MINPVIVILSTLLVLSVKYGDNIMSGDPHL